MIHAINAHHHFWDPDKGDYPWMTGPVAQIRCIFSPDSLRPLVASAGVSKTIPVQTWSSLNESRDLLDLAEETDFIAGIVVWVDLTAMDVGAQLGALPRLCAFSDRIGA